MSATFDANATADATSNGVTAQSLTALTVGVGTLRALVAQVAWSGTVTSPSLTWDNGGTNQAMAAIPGAGATNTVRAELWGLVNPISGNKTLRATWTTARDVCLNALSYTGVDQTGGATSFPNGGGTTGTSAAGTNTGQAAITVTSAVGNAAVMVSASAGGGFTVPTQTQTFNDITPATMSAGGQRAVGAASVAFSWTMVNASAWASAGTDILADAGGGGLTVAQEIPAIYQAMSGCIIGRVDA